MELVDNNGVGIEAVQRVRVARERLKDGGRSRKVNIIPPLFQHGPELRALLYHVHGLGERLFRLVFLGRDAINLRRALVVCYEEVEGEGREEGRLSIFPPHKKERLSKTAVSRRPLEPPEKRLYESLLKEVELEGSPERPL